MSQAENILQQTIDIITTTFADDVDNVSEYVVQAIESNKKSLEQLIDAKSQGQLSEGEFKAELDREKLVFKTQLLTISVMEKAMVNKICNLAFKQITKLINPVA